MRNLFTKTTLLGILTATLLAPLVFFALPQKAHAIPVVDAGNIAQNTITATNTTVGSFNTMSLQIKAFILDTLATTLAKQLIRQITASVVNWINSGFEGSPSFIENPASFFIDVADQITGEFLAQNNGPLNQLCSPFSIDLRLQLAFKYHPKIHTKYKCTLGEIIRNSATAVNNASINGQSIQGFMKGDFRQGGIPAFVSLTTEPQNNPYGAYLEADSELGIRVANSQQNKQQEISNGKGFLSWRNRSCMKDVKRQQQIQKAAQNIEDTDAQNAYNAEVDATGGDFGIHGAQTEQDCPIETPGSLIQGTVLQHITGPTLELELVDSINEIVNALAAQMINTVLQGGLKAISGAGPSDTTAYLYQVQAEAGALSADTVEGLTYNIDSYLTRTRQYKTNRDQAVTIINGLSNKFDTARQCYTSKLANLDIDLSPAQVQLFNQRVAEIDAAVAERVTPLRSRLIEEALEAQTRIDILTKLRREAAEAKAAAALASTTKAFNDLVQRQRLTTPQDILASEQDIESARAAATEHRLEAETYLLQCQNGGVSLQPRTIN